MPAPRLMMAAGAIVVWAAAVAWSVMPASAREYLNTAGSAAQDSLSATGTVLLVGRADLDGKLLSPYVSTVLDDAQRSAATATKDLLVAPVPDGASAAVRADLLPLLVEASDGITAVQSATADRDDDAVRAALAKLAPVSDRLQQFVEDQQ